jgi:hypothetical protein
MYDDIQDIIREEGNFKFAIKGKYVLVASRHRKFGHWCGYISQPEGVDLSDLICHGGITYNSRTMEWDDRVYVGFDCSHLFDISPYVDRYSPEAVYRDLDFVWNNLLDMYQQALIIENEGNNG